MIDFTKQREQTKTRTRNVYFEQHNNYLKDSRIFNRFLNMFSDISYLHLKKEDLRGAKVLDAGCGNSAYLQVALHQMGVGHQTCLDLETNWIGPLKGKLEQYDIGEENVSFVSGSTDALPFADEEFNAVFSNGVLPCLNDLNQIEKSFLELARVTKSGGFLYIALGSSGGLFEAELLPAIRRYYQENAAFKQFIDTLSPAAFQSIFQFIASQMWLNTQEKFEYDKIAHLFDLELCTSFQNVIQSPKRFCMELDEAWVIREFEKHGFGTPKRCERFVKRENIRKYFAPLHFNIDHPVSRVFYGSGNLEYIAKKH